MSEDEIRSAVKEYLKNDILNDPNYPMEDDEPLISSGLVDSFSLVDIALWVENTYDVHIEDSELTADNFDTVADLAAHIKANK